MKNKLLALSALFAIALAAPASASQIAFSFATSTPLIGGPVTGSGIFTTADTSTTVGGQTAFAILSITGMVNGSAIAAPVMASAYGNYFATGPSFLDGTGIAFKTAAGTTVDFFYQDTVSQYRVNTFSPGSSSFVTASASPVATVPEPASWALFLSALGAAGAALQLRRKKAATMA
jgi:hypothetical protein